MPIVESPNLPQGDKDMDEIMANKNNLTVGEIQGIIKYLEIERMQNIHLAEKAQCIDTLESYNSEVKEIENLIKRLQEQQIQ